MARDFRTSRYRGGAGIGEDVNPSAYIVNLADCMLVLACGFLVALVTFYNIDMMPVTELEDEDLEQVEPEQLPEDLLAGGGSYYVEAGTVYRDPSTGVLYMVETPEEGEGAADGAAGASNAAGGSGAAGSAGADASSGAAAAPSSANNADAARTARANGAD